MAKGVLGNDPFQRGAATRGAAEPKQSEKKPEKAKAPPAPKPAAKASKVKSEDAAPFLAPPDKEPVKSRIKKKRTAGRSSLPPPPSKLAKTKATRPPAPAPSKPEPELSPEPVRAEPPQPEAAVAPPIEARPAAPPQLHVIQGEGGAAPVERAPEPDRHEPATPHPERAASSALGKLAETASCALRVLRSGLGGSASELDSFGKDPEVERALMPLADFLYQHYWRVQVSGAERIPRGPAILVANHAGALPFDGPVLYAALKRERPGLPDARWLVEDQVFFAPVVGALLNRLGAVRASPENAVRLLGEQRPLIVFPEGIHGLQKPFAERYQLKRFGRGGFVRIALQTGAPIVPVAIVGAEETMPLLARIPTHALGLPYFPVTPLGPIPLPARWHIKIGAALTADDLRAGGEDEAARMKRGTELTRAAIQEMLEAALRDRQSVFR